MDFRVDRRSILKNVAVVGTAASFTGCSSIGGPSPPDEDTNPRELLPEPPETWDQIETQEQAAGVVGAEAGYAGRYENLTSTYSVEVLRWSSQDDAVDTGSNTYADWAIFVVHGNFGFAANGPGVSEAVELLAHTPTLTEKLIEENNMNT